MAWLNGDLDELSLPNTSQIRRDRQPHSDHRIIQLATLCSTHQREILLGIHSPQLAKHFTREMERLWLSANLGITKRLRRKLERGCQHFGSEIERDSFRLEG